jgi:hypothetical protein
LKEPAATAIYKAEQHFYTVSTIFSIEENFHIKVCHFKMLVTTWDYSVLNHKTRIQNCIPKNIIHICKIIKVKILNQEIYLKR